MDWITNIQAMSDWIRSWGAVAIAGSILLHILISITGVLPSIFLSGASAVVFGMEGGFFVSHAGEVSGAALAFVLSRWGSRKIKKLQKWKESRWLYWMIRHVSGK
ncbi:hypothetical protein P9G84_02425 [Brevibacillus centrosporus]|uniref:hypothetical protein n=1 Tax=Brevibacillus centrosporus TaxID=54910 RepID=UPI001FE304E0|nr:hypothetical protein [Brevibacillus centrosporus]MEC2127849.1 hypothetical protein [Brevibacillus centrosporus]